MEHTTTSEVPDSQAAVQELTRPNEGRMIAGVAVGLAIRFNLPVLLIRFVFVLLSFAGGLGIALYAAGWLLVRSEDEAETPAQRLFSGASSTRAWIGIGLVFVAALILLDNFTFLSGGVIWAVGLLIVGVLLYTGDLPRLAKRSETKEGVQQMTTTESNAAETAKSASPPDRGTAPPRPTPTPPILPPSKPKESSYLGRLTIGLMVLGVGLLALFDNIEGVPVYAEPRHYMALAVTILGLGLVIGAFVGRARWLIIVAVVLVPTLLFSPVFEWNWSSDTFDRNVAVTSFESLDNSYSIDVGNLTIDLTQLPWDGESVDLTARVDAGNIQVLVPADVAVTGTASVDVGRVASPGRESAGIGNPRLDFDYPGADGEINLDLSVDVGNIDLIITPIG